MANKTKEEFKEAGAGLGHAFKKFGKTFLRSAARVMDKADGNGDEGTLKEDGTSVFSDGSWKEVGKDLGNAFLDTGKAVLHTPKHGVDAINEKVNSNKEE